MKDKIKLTERQVDTLIDFAFVLTLCSFILYAFIRTLEVML